MTTAPEWTKNETTIDEAKGYLREGNTIDFFERVTRAILSEKPQEVEVYALGLIEGLMAGQDIPLNLHFIPQTPEAHAFMHERRLSEFIDAWVLALLEARPASDSERLEFHRSFLQSRIEQMRQQAVQDVAPPES